MTTSYDGLRADASTCCQCVPELDDGARKGDDLDLPAEDSRRDGVAS